MPEYFDLNRKNILVVGLGVTGLATARFLHRRGAVVTVTDLASDYTLGQSVTELHQLGIRTELGIHRRESFESADMIVISPGIPHTVDLLMRAREKGIPVLGEIELAFRFVREPIIAITGTNGKTTTTSLLGAILTQCGMRVFVGGNIGNPLIGYADHSETVDWIVLEVSSFQLDTIEFFRPDIGILLNITEDHLDRYPDMAGYAASKGKLFQNQTSKDIAIINGADPWVQKVTHGIKSFRWIFNGLSGQMDGAVITKHSLSIAASSCPFRKPGSSSVQPTTERFQIDTSQSRLHGKHNQENICAAAMAALAVGCSIHGIQSCLNQFSGLSHRIEFVRTLDGVTYLDDSKATNVDAVFRALECFHEPIILIMGGRDKDGNYDVLKPLIRDQVKYLILLGEASDLIYAVLGSATRTDRAVSMEDAVAKAHASASEGDVVLLSPACSSFDMFKSYTHRGEMFKTEVNKL